MDNDLISRQAVSSWLKQYGQDVLHGKYKFSLMYIWKNLMDLPSAQPVATDTNVGDTISRQAAIDALDCINGTEEVLRSLPPAQTEPHEGHWIWVAGDLECSKCHTRYPDLYPDYDNSVACPHCGARMKGATT